MREKFKMVLSYLCMIPAVLLIGTVFIIDNSIPQSIVMGQAFWFFEALALLSISVFISFMMNRKQFRHSFIDLVFLLFVVSGVSITWVIAREWMPEMTLLSCSLLLYFLLKTLLYQHKNTCYILTICLVLTGLAEAIWGLKQLYGFTQPQHSLFKTSGSFYNPGPYAGYLAMIAPVALHYCFKNWHCLYVKIKPPYWKPHFTLAVAILTLACILVVLPATGSRASWLAAMFGCSVVFITERQKLILWIRNNTRKLGFYCLVGAIFTGFAGYGLYIFKKDSADGRALIWKNTVELIKDNPTGVGLGFYAGDYGKYQAQYFEKNGTEKEKMIAGSPEYAFNEYLQICAEFGIIGLLLFITLITTALTSAFKNARYGPLGGLTALLIFAGMSYPFSLVPFVVSFVLLLTLCTCSPSPTPPISKEAGIYKSFLFFFNVWAVGAMAYTVVQTKQVYEAYKAWGTASYLYQAKAYKNANELYTPQYSYLKNNIEYLFQYGQILSHLQNYYDSNVVLQRATHLSSDPMVYNLIGKNYQAMGNYNKASAYYALAMNMVPHRLYPYYLSAQMYMENKETEKARQMARKLLNINIKVASPATKQMRAEMHALLASAE